MLRSCNLPENDCKAVLSALQSKFILMKWKNHYQACMHALRARSAIAEIKPNSHQYLFIYIKKNNIFFIFFQE